MSLHRLNANDVFLNERNVVMKVFIMIYREACPGCEPGGVIGWEWEAPFLLPLCWSCHQHHHVTQRGTAALAGCSILFSPVRLWNNGH